MFQEIWKWDDAEKRVKFDREHSPQAGSDSSDGGMVRLVEEAARWRRLYESKSIECARLQKELEKRNG